MIVNLKDTSGNYDSAFLGNWAEIYMVDALLRNPGCQVTNFDFFNIQFVSGFSLRNLLHLVLQRPMLSTRSSAQNTDYAIGQIGTEPLPRQVAFQYQLSAIGQLPKLCVQRNHREGGSRWLDSEVE